MDNQSGQLNEISQAIGALQEGQRQAEEQRRNHAQRTEQQFNLIDVKLDDFSMILNQVKGGWRVLATIGVIAGAMGAVMHKFLLYFISK